AFIPSNGKSMLDLQPPEVAERQRAEAELGGEGWRIHPLSAAYFRIADAGDNARIDRCAVDQPIRTMAQKARLTGAWEKIPHLAYTRAAGHARGPFAQF